MTVANHLLGLNKLRRLGIRMFNVDPAPGEQWSYQLDESDLLLLTLRRDIDDIRAAKSDAEAQEIWNAIRPFVRVFHVGGNAPN